MAKKSFNIGEQNNLKGAGIGNFFPDKKEAVESNAKVEKTLNEEEEAVLIKTFSILESDFEFINKYMLYKGFKDGKKCTQKAALNDAIKLLREKYPEVK